MNFRISVDLRRRGLQNLGAGALGEAEKIYCALHVCAKCLDRVDLILNRACRRREIIDLVHFGIEGAGHVVTQRFEVWTSDEAGDVFLAASKVVVQAENVMPLGNKAFA